MRRLTGKTAIVTGAGTGIGRGIAEAFAREGASVVAAGRRPEPIAETARRISEAGGRGLALPTDVSDAGQIADLVEATTVAFGSVDILVNSAGVHVPGGILATTEEQWDWLMGINLKGVFLCCKAVAPAMLQRSWGRIISVASVGALTPSQNAAYCASKGAIVTLTKSMALDLSPRGVTVNAICPGPITTEMTRERFEDPTTRAEQLAKSRVGFFGEPSDIAAGAVYLASEDARFVTGSVLSIDAGWSIG